MLGATKARSFFLRLAWGTSLVFILSACGDKESPTAGTKTSDIPSGADPDRYENLVLFQKVLQTIERNYVEPKDNKVLVYGAIKGMLETLDVHSTLLAPTASAGHDEDSDETFDDDIGNEVGRIGIEAKPMSDILTITSIIRDAPASKAGLHVQDQILKIDGVDTSGLPRSKTRSMLQGEIGSQVKLSIRRKGIDGLKEFSLKREQVQRSHEPMCTVLSDAYVYLRLRSIKEGVADQVRAELQKATKKFPIRGLIVDIRDNGGGLVNEAVNLVSLFIDKGPVVSMVGRDKKDKKVRYAKGAGPYQNIPIVVLVNQRTASAAEIFAAALQDYQRARIAGQRSVGKGTVQTVLDLGRDHLRLKLTIGHYFTPKGRGIEKVGVEPDSILPEPVFNDGESSLSTFASPKNDSQVAWSLNYLKTQTSPKESKAVHEPEVHVDSDDEVPAAPARSGNKRVRWDPPIFHWSYNPDQAPAWLNDKELFSIVERAVNSWQNCGLKIVFDERSRKRAGDFDGVSVIGWDSDLTKNQRGRTTGHDSVKGGILERDILLSPKREEFRLHPRLLEKVIAHEAGHALGLRHSANCDELMSVGGKCPNVDPDKLPVTPQTGDLAACKNIYGPKDQVKSGKD